ncbi:hypothetical protein TraAM80_04674 [Trypanosoma rangeli]|uniref:Uncharacterized protein n=1 Tax=Trypanosoma rangeli TaxID=5698 RepID=A0A3R7KNG7_TRYRA|nr:uncharacterized protein TraAM80_04674 [Trypanosoma rangeli]RNF05261.1 hypothetical protein TraAM80_04674 [Trypanosoma rangeli]|eukprot:RNF05261.1 hypothetical protein TraAM80_04674 [Trypanosoma rangeli]
MMENAQSLPSRQEALLAAPYTSTDSQAPAGRLETLSKVLAFCLMGLSQDAAEAVTDAESLQRKYEGLEGELLSALSEKYGHPPGEFVERARELLGTSMKRAPHEPRAPLTEVERTEVVAPVTALHPILARMQLEREEEDASWRRVHAAAKDMLMSLEEMEVRVEEQEIELARLTSDHSRRLRLGEAEDGNPEALRANLASTVTHLQLTLLRLRGATQVDGDSAGVLSDVEYKRRMLSVQQREEEDLIQVYRRVLRQHLTSHSLSPLCEEIRRVDAQLRQLMPESPV